MSLWSGMFQLLKWLGTGWTAGVWSVAWEGICPSSELLTMVTMKVIVFWDVIVLEGACCLHLQSGRRLLRMEAEVPLKCSYIQTNSGCYTLWCNGYQHLPCQVKAVGAWMWPLNLCCSAKVKHLCTLPSSLYSLDMAHAYTGNFRFPLAFHVVKYTSYFLS
jgi:hypothetical protein